MNNILLISTIYPIFDSQNHGTKVCHYFAQDWIKMGYNVRVVHYQAIYPRPFYWIAKLMRNYLAAKTGAVIYTTRELKVLHYNMDGVPVIRIPLYKPLPHGKFATSAVIKSIAEIVNDDKKAGFVPDVIVGHFINPQLEVLSLLKSYYPNAKTTLIYHLSAEIQMVKNVYGKRYDELISAVDVLGFRNITIRKEFEKIATHPFKSFICYSGVPEEYVAIGNHKYNDRVKEFIYVGEMIERKYPALIIDALQEAYRDDPYHINYIGVGQQIKAIKRKVKSYNIDDKVTLKGRIPRNQIKQLYDQADCMIMISRGEAYGLAYLEAMARGCIVVASRNEGFDGIIKDGVNGYLCNAGDRHELAKVIIRIKQLSNAEKQNISRKAIETAKWLTDHNAAKIYIENIVKLTE